MTTEESKELKEGDWVALKAQILEIPDPVKHAGQKQMFALANLQYGFTTIDRRIAVAPADIIRKVEDDE